jgi:hypothetical protein
MTATMNTDEQRQALRQQLQTHRRILISMVNPAPEVRNDSFPRSMTMRMLTGKSTMVMLILAEVLPLLLARYISKSSLRADNSR